MLTDDFKQGMHRRNGIEGTLSGLFRGQRLRNSRYRGKNKVRLGIKFAAASANIRRLHKYNEENRAAKGSSGRTSPILAATNRIDLATITSGMIKYQKKPQIKRSYFNSSDLFQRNLS